MPPNVVLPISPDQLPLIFSTVSVIITTLLLIKQLFFSNTKQLHSEEIRCKKLFLCTGDLYSDKIQHASPRLGIYTQDGRPQIVLLHDNVKPALSLEINSDGNPNISMFDRQGGIRTSCCLDEDNIFSITYIDSTNDIPFHIQASDQGASINLAGDTSSITIALGKNETELPPIISIQKGESITTFTPE
ncbi:hypothetical protein GEMRC1_011653 [Eukaryota sp. GEM-RC1]